jgi:hypothetical protein
MRHLTILPRQIDFDVSDNIENIIDAACAPA